MHLVKRRDVVVPFEQRGGWSATLDRTAVQPSDGLDHGVVVSVQGVALEL